MKLKKIKKVTKINLLVVAVLILSWATPSFCPLTFVQANTLKSLPRTADNLAKIRAAVEAAGPKDRSGLNVIAKAFGLGTSASKEEILAAINSATPNAAPVAGAGPAELVQLAVDVATAGAAEKTAEAATAAAAAAEQVAARARQAALTAERQVAAEEQGQPGAAAGSGPLTFVQANTLKSLPVTSENLDKIIAAVNAASDRDQSGIKVLAKHFKAVPNRAGLLARLRELKNSPTAGAPEAAPAVVAEPAAASASTGVDELTGLNTRLIDLYAQLADNAAAYKAADAEGWSWGKSDKLKALKAAGAELEAQIYANEHKQLKQINKLQDNQQKLVAAFNVLQAAGLLLTAVTSNEQRVLTNIKMDKLFTGAAVHKSWVPLTKVIEAVLKAGDNYDKQEEIAKLEQLKRIVRTDNNEASLIKIAEAWQVPVKYGDENTVSLAAKLIAKIEAQIAEIQAGQRPALLVLPSTVRSLEAAAAAETSADGDGDGDAESVGAGSTGTAESE